VTLSSQVDWSAVQSWQAAPLSPHDVSTKPGWHTPLESQHPTQFAGPHIGGGTHWPAPLQTSPISMQSAQKAPAIPHCTGLSPPAQVLPTQHPLQVLGLHGGGIAQNGESAGVVVSQTSPN
jgi:hypothetical protein